MIWLEFSLDRPWVVFLVLNVVDVNVSRDRRKLSRCLIVSIDGKSLFHKSMKTEFSDSYDTDKRATTWRSHSRDRRPD